MTGNDEVPLDGTVGKCGIYVQKDLLEEAGAELLAFCASGPAGLPRKEFAEQNAAPRLKIDWHVLLLQAVAFHEHSHAARGSRLDKPVEVLRAEETIAQWEAYMYLKSRPCGEDPCIDAMKKLMERQPPCYHIPVP